MPGRVTGAGARAAHEARVPPKTRALLPRQGANRNDGPLEEADMTLITDLRDRRQALHARVRALIDTVEREARDLTAGELEQVTELRTQLDGIEDHLADLAVAAERRENATRADSSPDPRQERATASVLSEPRTYDGRPGGNSILADMFRAQRLNDVAAFERLQRHSQEARVEQRDVTTGAFGGLVAPVYLLEEFAPVLRNSRALANAARRIRLPDTGMSVIVPRAQSGVTVAPQDTQNTAVSETDVDFDNDLTIGVKTFAGQQDVSRQTLERGTAEIDRLIFADLVSAYGARLDSSIINDDGTAGTHKGVRSATGVDVVTYTDATPTVTEFWPKLVDAIQQIAAERHAPADLICMHPRRWGWLLAGLDSANRPLIIGDATAAMNTMGTANAANFGEGQLVGTLMGVPVIVDGNIPTTVGGGTEDVVIVAHRGDLLLAEEGDGMPRQLRFEDVGSATLTVKLLAYSYSAFTAEQHPEGIKIITGTGLIAPAF